LDLLGVAQIQLNRVCLDALFLALLCGFVDRPLEISVLFCGLAGRNDVAPCVRESERNLLA
jgi:hypothetical protein